jgi:hypothetical protein
LMVTLKVFQIAVITVEMACGASNPAAASRYLQHDTRAPRVARTAAGSCQRVAKPMVACA